VLNFPRKLADSQDRKAGQVVLLDQLLCFIVKPFFNISVILINAILISRNSLVASFDIWNFDHHPLSLQSQIN
jgi:hypothetical protein